jgi:hypothetical protein
MSHLLPRPHPIYDHTISAPWLLPVAGVVEREVAFDLAYVTAAGAVTEMVVAARVGAVEPGLEPEPGQTEAGFQLSAGQVVAVGYGFDRE